MTVKKSISLSDESVDILKSRKTYRNKKTAEVVFSTSINQIIENYEKIVKESTPRLNASEWHMLVNVYKNTFTQKAKLPINIATDMMAHKGKINMECIAKSDVRFANLINKVNLFN